MKIFFILLTKLSVYHILRYLYTYLSVTQYDTITKIYVSGKYKEKSAKTAPDPPTKETLMKIKILMLRFFSFLIWSI